MRQMLLSELSGLLLNPSVETADETRLSKQAICVWGLFSNGTGRYRPVWTQELRAAAAQYSARLWEIRNWLKDFGLTIDCVERDSYGNHKFIVTELAGSNYERLLRRKGASR